MKRGLVPVAAYLPPALVRRLDAAARRLGPNGLSRSAAVAYLLKRALDAR